jgi:hypothetical protein
MAARLTTLLAALAAAAALAGVAGADPPTPTNNVSVETTGQNAVQIKSNMQLAPMPPPATEADNLAQAYSHDCTDCRTVAVAIQVLFVRKTPSSFSPQNLALAVNQSCTRCATFAYAWQYVASVPGRPRIDPGAVAHVMALRRQMAQIAESGEPLDQMNADLDALTADLKSTLDGQLADQGDEPGHAIERHEQESD